jgi:opacity protein-like surface antigen
MKRQNNIKTTLLGVCLAVCAGLAQAQTQTIDRGLYFGAGLGESEAKNYDCNALPQCQEQGTAVKYFVGYQFARHWSAELGFTDLGKVHSSVPGIFNEEIKSRLGELTVVGSYPFTGSLMIYGKLGAYYAKTTDDFTLSGTSGRLSEADWGPTWGFGLQYYLTRGLAVRGEAQRYMKVGGGDIGDSDFNALTIGLLYKLH